MKPAELETRWEFAYRRYCDVARQAAAAPPDEENVARLMAATSAEVAAAWREMQGALDLPWWVLAALSAAVEAFEAQARNWALRVPEPAAEPAPDDTATTPFPRPFPRPFHSASIVDEEPAPEFWRKAGA